MKSFDEIYKIVEETSHEVAFNRGECEALYDSLHKLSDKSNIVEIGVQFGRSATVILEVAKEKNFNVSLVDNWLEDMSREAREHLLSQAEKYGWKFKDYWMSSNMASKLYQGKIDLIHIDGDHNYEGVLSDMTHWLPKVKSGGFALFDDYGHDSLPGVFQAVTEYFTEHGNWIYLGRFGNKLGIFQKK